MKKILLIVITITQFLFLKAQKGHTDANIIGDVQCNGEHVPFINITIDGTTIGTTTDGTGHFQLIDMPIGTFTLRASGVGYKNATKTITTEKDKTIEVKFVLIEDVMNLDAVVVSADRNQTNRLEAPVVVTSISPKLFTTTQSVNMAEGLSFTPGLRTENNCQNCGFTQLRINGLDGPYSQILMNSRPVFSGLAGVYGLELIPVSMIDRLEVVRGGGSALFGGNAIAGTVNIITKEPTSNTFSADTRYSLIGSDGEHEQSGPAADRQTNVNVSMVSSDSKTGAFLYATLRDRDEFDENGDGFSEEVAMENTTFGFSLFHKPGSKSKISIDAYRIKEFRRGGSDLDKLPHEARIAEQLDHLISGGNVAFDYFTSQKSKLSVYTALQTVDRDSYYGAEMDPNAYGFTEDLTNSSGAQYYVSSEKFLFAPSSTVFGIDNTYNYLVDTKLGANGDSNIDLTDQAVNTTGAFAQHDWKTKKLNFSLGLRVDSYSIDDRHGEGDFSNTVVLPRASAMYKLTDKTRIRATYGNGYRAPQVFNEDLHIELITAQRVEHLNSPDLQEETSQSFTLSLNSQFSVGSIMNDFLIEGFYTLLQNPFRDEFFLIEKDDPVYGQLISEDEDEVYAFLKINGEEAFVQGVNVEYNSYYLDKIDFQFGFTVQQSRYSTEEAWGEEEGSVTGRFWRTPDTYGFLTLAYTPVKRFTAAVTMNYTGAMYVPHAGGKITSLDSLASLRSAGLNEDAERAEAMNKAIEDGDIIEGERLEKSEDFLITDVQLTYKIPLSKEVNLEVFGGVKNIFNQTQVKHDKGVFRDAAYIYGPCKPRTITFGLKVANF